MCALAGFVFSTAAVGVPAFGVARAIVAVENSNNRRARTLPRNFRAIACGWLGWGDYTASRALSASPNTKTIVSTHAVIRYPHRRRVWYRAPLPIGVGGLNMRIQFQKFQFAHRQHFGVHPPNCRTMLPPQYPTSIVFRRCNVRVTANHINAPYVFLAPLNATSECVPE